MATRHLSQSDLDLVYKKELKQIGKQGFEEFRKEIQEKSKKPEAKNSIFLCHSHLDKTIVNKMLALFQGLNVDLYIDWMDDSLPSHTDKNTASAIKTKIAESQKFLFLATYNALRSKWCNWELGLAYSSKGENDFAILPIESKSGKWLGSEYLQLYPEMQINSLDQEVTITEKDIRINFYNERVIDFRSWLQKSGRQ